MKVALVSFGYVAPSLMLAKYISKKIKLSVYLLLSQTFKKTSALDFSSINVNDGMMSDGLTKKVIGSRINQYIDGSFELKIFVYNTSRAYAYKNLKLSYQFSKNLKRHKYDLIHYSGNDLSQMLISSFLPRIPRVHTIHDYIGHEGERKLSAEIFNKYLMRTRDHKIFLSEWCARQAGSERQEHGLVDIVPFSLQDIYRLWEDSSLQEKANTILFFGRISPYKGIRYLIEAVPFIKKHIAGLKVTLAGEGQYDFDIGALAADDTYRVINRFVSSEELARLVQESSIVVCPYTGATQSAVIMTAYAFNKPVVTTNVGGIPEVVEDQVTGILVPPRDPEKLSEVIIDLLKNTEKRKKMSRDIEAKYNKGVFSWDNIADMTIRVYQKAIHNHS